MQPEEIGPYIIEKKIGAGGMGTVYLAHHRETNQQVAVKVLSASLAREEGYVARFAREIDALQQLNNPHIVKVFESGLSDEACYYAMEYVDGETLTTRLRRDRKIGWKETVEIALQICSALKAAHDAGIIHRDLKPSNLIIEPNGKVMLTDFGVAQVFAGRKLTATGGVLGTAEYMSPEQAQGQRTTKQSDLYSLGAVMYVMLTGRPPFTGKTTLEIMQKHRYGQFDRPKMYVDDIPYWLDELVCQLLEKNPDDRVPDALVLSKKLQEVLNKVQLSSDDATQHQASYSGDAPTVDAVASNESAEYVVAGDHGPGSATLMRDLIRAEVQNQNKPTLVSSFFNNTWVLLLLLLLLIAGGVMFFQDHELTPQQKFNAGMALMNQPAGDNWIQARDKFFLPLIADDAKTWKAEVTPQLDKISMYELERRIQGKRPGRQQPRPTNKAERLLFLSKHYDEAGDYSRAVRLLKSLVTLTAGQTTYSQIHDIAEKRLAELQSQATTANATALIDAAVTRAKKLESEGKQAEAIAIWQSIIDLYANDPSAKKQVATARAHL